MISAVILLVVAITVDICDQCCTAYQCSDFKSSTKCFGGNDWDTGFPCFWESNTCRKGKCADLKTGSACNSYSMACQWNSTACVEVNSCGSWSGTHISDCSIKRYNNIWCVADGQTCRQETCPDLEGSGQSYCENNGLQCKYTTSSTCVASSSCSDWDADLSNCMHQFGKDYCMVVGSVCKVPSCGDFGSSQTTCENYGCKYSGGSCTEVSSCSGWSGTNLTACQSRSYNGTSCKWENNVCKSYTCDDFGDNEPLCLSGNSSSVNYCKWKDNKCVYVQTYCEAQVDGEIVCDTSSSKCTYLSGACPSPPVEETPSGSFRTIVPATMVVLALVFSLLW